MTFSALNDFREDKEMSNRVADMLTSREMRVAMSVAWNEFTMGVRGDDAPAKIAGARDFISVLDGLCRQPAVAPVNDYNLKEPKPYGR